MDRLVFDIGEFRVDGNQRRLFDRAGQPVPLSARAFDVLMFMVQRPGELLDKKALMNAVWPDTVVEENNLTQCVFSLRRALGDSAGEPRYIVNVPGRGYQLVAPVRALNDEATESETSGGLRLPVPIEASANPSSPGTLRSRTLRIGAGVALAAALAIGAYLFWPHARPNIDTAIASDPNAAPPNSIAVLPFVDKSPDGDMEYFADGIAEELTTGLASVASLRVSGRRSSFAFKGKDDDLRTIGEKLRVSNILEGTVRKQGDRIRVSAQLSRASDGESLWTAIYDRNLDDVLDVESTIAREVLAALAPVVQRGNHSRTAVLDAALTGNAGAYNAYLRGNFFLARATAEDTSRARDEFARAVELDPQFAMAHALLARAHEYLWRQAIGDVERNKSMAFASLERALKLNPAIRDLWWVQSRFVEGPGTPLSLRAGSLERALAYSPGDADAMVRLSDIYFRQGRFAEGLELSRRAYEVDPLWPHTVWWLAFTGYTFDGNEKLALERLGELEVLAPTNPRGPTFRAWVAMNEGRAFDWDRAMERAIAVAPLDETTHRFLAMDYGDLGALDAALYHARVARLIAPENAAGWHAAAHILLVSGDVAGARMFVEEAIATKSGDYQSHFAQAELHYFTGNCAGAIQSLLLGRPALGQPEAALDLLADPERATVLAWCHRRQGNVKRAAEIARVFEREHAPPMVSGMYDGARARMAAALSDRAGLIVHLTALAKTKAPIGDFSRHEPMIQPYLEDPEVKPLLARLEARRAEWRKVLPKASMRVPIPGLEAAK